MRNLILVSVFLLSLGFSVKGFAQTVNPQNDTAIFPYWIEMMQNQDANFFQTVRAFEAYWNGREVTKGSGYKPFKRWEYMMRQRVKPDGSRPAPDAQINALNRFQSKQKSRNLYGNWVSLGPENVPSGYNGYRGLGRIAAIAFHPVDGNKIYIGAPAGGLWVTENHGESWEVLTDHLPTLGISSIVVNSENPDQILIGTGDRDAGDAPGLGVWRSDDGGENWEVSNDGIGNKTVGRMIQHPDNADEILAATNGGIYKSTNGGITWTLKIGANFKDIVYKPGYPNIVYAASGGNFFRSEDGGESFVQITNGLPGGARGVIGVSPANAEVVYFFLTNSDSFKGLYRSDNSGLSFQMRSNSPNIMSWDCNGGSGGQAWYDLDISVDQQDADIIIAGGVNSFQSTDGGTSWSIRSHWYGGCGVQSVHADLHVLEYSPVTGELFVGNDGGIYWTNDGGVSWTEVTNGLVISQAYKLGQSKTNPDFVLNGYQDNGTSTFTGDNWVNVGGGDGMECAYDPTDDKYSYTTVYYGSIDRHYNHNYQGQIAGEGVNGITEGGAWVTPFLIDHEDGNVMFIGYKNVWRSSNIKAGSTSSVQWTKISSMSNSNLNNLVQSPVNTNILYASSDNRLFYTDNAKNLVVTWSVLTTNLPTNNTITALETSPFDENIVYMAQQDKIYKSTDKGLTWSDISGSLSGIQINSIAFYRNSIEGLYVGTDVGVFFKDANMDDWSSFSDGMPASVRVTEVEFYYDPENPSGDLLRAATYGRGLWSSSPFFGALEAEFMASSTDISANCTVHFTDLTQGTPYEWIWTFEGGNPESSTEQNPQNISFPEEGSYSVRLIVTNPLGNDTIEKPDYINVSLAAAPEADFAADHLAGCTGLIVQFSDHSNHCPTAWQWSITPDTYTFLEETSAESQNPIVQFDALGAYTITLHVSNEIGSDVLMQESMIHVGGFSMPYEAVLTQEAFDADGWTVENPDNSRSWALTTIEEEEVLWMHFYNYYGPNQRDYLISPAFNLGGTDKAFLMFDYAYAQRFPLTDSLIISVSGNCGDSWQRVYANGPDGQGVFETAQPTDDYFVPATAEDWCGVGYGADCPVIDLSNWIGSTDVKLRFETFNKYGNNLYLKNIVVSSFTNTFEVDQANSVAVFPNPAKDYFTVQYQSPQPETVLKLKDMKGNTVVEKTLNASTVTVKTQGLAAGVYLLMLESKDAQVKKKIVIQ